MGKVFVAAFILLAGSGLTEVGLPSMMPPDGMVMPVRLSAVGNGAPTLSVLPAGPITSQVVRLGSLHPLFADVPPGGYPHDTYVWGNCTWWVAYNRLVPPFLGDAKHWLANAAGAGLPTAAQPSVGAIVVYRASPGYNVVHGHVAVVIVVGPTSFRVSEMNFVGLGEVDQRDSPWPDWHVEGFIPR